MKETQYIRVAEGNKAHIVKITLNTGTWYETWCGFHGFIVEVRPTLFPAPDTICKTCQHVRNKSLTAPD